MDPEKVLLILRERGDLSTEGRGDEDLGVFFMGERRIEKPRADNGE